MSNLITDMNRNASARRCTLEVDIDSLIAKLTQLKADAASGRRGLSAQINLTQMAASIEQQAVKVDCIEAAALDFADATR